ncbi:MAG TPA: hypothetical protein VKF62_12775, partial [Planctomycetota bacterium]|nr:hypothetical protein [Planctomycetota bacterium]
MRSFPLVFAVAMAGTYASALASGDPPKLPIPSSYRRAFGATMHEGKAVAECAFLHADFDADGAHLLFPERSDGFAPRLDLRLLGAGRGGGPDAVGPVLGIAVEGSTVSMARGPVTEKYEIREDGLEQVALLAAPVPGGGDLVVRYEVSTPLLACATGPARPGDLVFSGPAGPAVRYGEATAIDGGGRRTSVSTAFDGVSRLDLVVPAAFVDAATFPLTIDPILAPAFLIDPTNQGFTDVSPDVAFTEGTFLVVWERVIAAGDHRIRAFRYDQGGTSLGSLIEVDAAASLSENPSVAGDPSNANEFLVVWQDSTDGGTTYDIRARHVDGDDGSMDAEFTIASAGAGEKLRRPDVGGEGDGGGVAVYFVAWDKTLSGQTQAREIWWSMRGATPGFVYVGPTLLATAPVGDYVLDAAVSSLDTPGGPDALAWRVVWSRFFDSPAPGDFDVHTACIK